MRKYNKREVFLNRKLNAEFIKTAINEEVEKLRGFSPPPKIRPLRRPLWKRILDYLLKR